MVVLGNPPYSVSSSNKGEWIQNLITDYKKGLNERKHNIEDDYIKFIRYAQHIIEKNGEGVLAFISNNSFLDGTTHRIMRRSLMDSFNKIYILDLHGSTRKNETTPSGDKDDNVFDIIIGVSINIFIKTTDRNNPTDIYHCDVYGIEDEKYKYLFESDIKSIEWKRLNPKNNYYFFVPKDFASEDEYNSYFPINEMLKIYSSGIETAKDKFVINFTDIETKQLELDLLNLDVSEISKKYNLAHHKTLQVKNDVESASEHVKTLISYRPFDIRHTLYSENSQGILWRPRHDVMRHLLFKKNIALLLCKRQTSFDFQHIFLSNTISERCNVSMQTGELNYVFPLYLYPDNEQGSLEGNTGRTPNLNPDIVKEIEAGLGMTFTNEKEETENTFAPIDILDYIYAVLHSPSYRETFKEFLKIDFPRVPYPKDAETFWKLVELGGQIRQIHLLESPVVSQRITNYPQSGDNEVGRVKYAGGRVWINETQYFDNVPQTAWEFYIGGYQPAQKWLKDRKGRRLSFEDIMHYQKIIVALTETGRLMGEIDKIEFM